MTHTHTHTTIRVQSTLTLTSWGHIKSVYTLLHGTSSWVHLHSLLHYFPEDTKVFPWKITISPWVWNMQGALRLCTHNDTYAHTHTHTVIYANCSVYRCELRLSVYNHNFSTPIHQRERGNDSCTCIINKKYMHLCNNWIVSLVLAVWTGMGMYEDPNWISGTCCVELEELPIADHYAVVMVIKSFDGVCIEV